MGADASPPRRRARSRSRSPPRAGGGSRWERDGGDEDARRPAAAPTAAAARPPPPAPRGAGTGGSRWERGAGGGRRPGEQEEEDPSAAAAAAAAPPPPPPPPPIYKPNFEGLSGKLAAEANTVNGVVLKFAPPAEARVCKHPRWRAYVFKDLPPGAAEGKGDEGDDDDDGGGAGGGRGGATKQKKKKQEPVGDPIPLDRYPYYLFGKERRVADVPTDHPSCSRQHAVVCFREVERMPEGGLLPAAVGGAAAALAASRQTLPYLVDLETANGTFLNGERVEAGRFYELLDGDVVKFGASTREYVFIRER